jgi:hypothetical protein
VQEKSIGEGVAPLCCPSDTGMATSFLNSFSGPSKSPLQTKLNRLQSSSKLFIIGVPVIASRCAAGIAFKLFVTRALGFLILCASSWWLGSKCGRQVSNCVDLG